VGVSIMHHNNAVVESQLKYSIILHQYSPSLINFQLFAQTHKSALQHKQSLKSATVEKQ